MRSPASSGALRRRTAPLLVLAVGVLVTLVAVLLVHRADREHDELRFQRDAEAAVASIQAQTAGTMARLADISAFLASGADTPTRAHFGQFLGGAGLLGQSWLRALAFAEPVRARDAGRLEAREAAQGDPGFAVRTVQERGRLIVLTRTAGIAG